ncbi:MULTISPECIES: lipid II-degrading bacteriocin [unclassified Burkholderia]|uniref:lipid II-degrading bacteriocin n=1 Tax=unclassified Burkholderia TaxID=2613784 RepID=UPI0021AB9699|nr:MULTISPECIES: lipid II-degrading bacteriocin [unclassified Burkholderia]
MSTIQNPCRTTQKDKRYVFRYANQLPKDNQTGCEMLKHDTLASENVMNGDNKRQHQNRRRFLIASTALPLGTLLKHTTSAAQSNVLPPISVTAPRPPDFNFGDFNTNANEIPGANVGAGIPAPSICFNQHCASNYMLLFANTGNMVRATEMFLKHLQVFGKNDAAFWGSQLALVGGFTPWLARGGYKYLPGAKPYGLDFSTGHYADISTLFGIYAGQLQGIPPISEFEFYGNPLMFIGAISHWVYGNGQRRSMNIESLNLKMGISDFEQITKIVENPTYGPGAHALVIPFSTNIFSHGKKDLWSASTLGRISGHARGTLTLNSDNTYQFVGSYTLNPDRFDADRSNRDFLQEWATTFLRTLGNALGHTDYDIVFTGEKNVSFSGQRPIRNIQEPPPQAVHRPSFGGLMRPGR